MPYSASEGKPEIALALRKRYPTGAVILDVGPGAGSLRRLLPEKYVMDCIEVHAPYVQRFKLNVLYRHVEVGDIRYYIGQGSHYDVLLFGDVLDTLCDYALFSVPWTWPQEACEGNPHEKHEQDDLTTDLMAQRYPSLHRLLKGTWIGVYEWVKP